jgi:transcription antitermination factor NusG
MSEPNTTHTIQSNKLEWFVVNTRSRHEKFVSEQLRGKLIETFLPLYRSDKRWKNGQQSGSLPLFPGYLFVRIDIKRPLPVLQTSGVSRFVSFGLKPAAITDDEIKHLETAVSKGVNALPHPFAALGDRVRIKSGPLAGMTGLVSRDKQGMRLILSVDMISRSMSVELNAADVEAV